MPTFNFVDNAKLRALASASRIIYVYLRL